MKISLSEFSVASAKSAFSASGNTIILLMARISNFPP